MPRPAVSIGASVIGQSDLLMTVLHMLRSCCSPVCSPTFYTRSRSRTFEAASKHLVPGQQAKMISPPQVRRSGVDCALKRKSLTKSLESGRRGWSLESAPRCMIVCRGLLLSSSVELCSNEIYGYSRQKANFIFTTLMLYLSIVICSQLIELIDIIFYFFVHSTKECVMNV